MPTIIQDADQAILLACQEDMNNIPWIAPGED